MPRVGLVIVAARTCPERPFLLGGLTKTRKTGSALKLASTI